MIPLALLGLAALAQGAPDPSPSLAQCGFRPDARIVLDLAALPASVREQARRYVPGPVAARDAPFQRQDEIATPPLPTRRFVGAVSGRWRWVLLYEHGGFGSHVHALSFIQQGAAPVRGQYRLLPNGNLTGPLCEIAKASLAGVAAADPGHF